MVEIDEVAILRTVERWVSVARRARGLGDGAVGRLWAQLLAGTRGGRTTAGSSRIGRTAGDRAWEWLLALREYFGRFDLLPALEILIAVVGGERMPEARAELAAMRIGCGQITSYLQRGRRGDAKRPPAS